jgi:hypothetical protein
MFELASCPLCFSEQVQLCRDANNQEKDFCRCRACKCTGPLSLWQRRKEIGAYILALENLYMHGLICRSMSG